MRVSPPDGLGCVVRVVILALMSAARWHLLVLAALTLPAGLIVGRHGRKMVLLVALVLAPRASQPRGLGPVVVASVTGLVTVTFGRMAEWPDGRMAGWLDGRMAGWPDGRSRPRSAGWPAS